VYLNKRKKIFLSIVFIIILLSYKFLFLSSSHRSLYQHNQSIFYSVFLSNDQVYFGHITEETSSTIILKDVYYLKTTNPTSPGNTLNEATVSAKMSLVKLGKEMHGPKDQIVINREHVIYYEEMGVDSTIMKAIFDNEKRQ